MKKFVATIAMVGTALTLAACESTRDYDDEDMQVPYTEGRTAGNQKEADMRRPVSEERVFRARQTK